MNDKEKKNAYYLNLFFGYFLVLISIAGFLLAFKVQPIFNFFLNIFYVEKVHFFFGIIPGIASIKVFKHAEKFKVKK